MDVPPALNWRGRAYPPGGPVTDFFAPAGDALRPEVWSVFAAFHSSTDDVFLRKWTVPTATVTVANAGAPERFPHINANRIAWQGDARTEIYFRDITSGQAVPITLSGSVLLNTPEDTICRSYKWRPRVGGDGRYIIYRGATCFFNAANAALIGVPPNTTIDQVLWLTFLDPSTGHQKIYFVTELGPNHPDAENTEYDIDQDQLIWSDGTDLFLFDINEAAL